MQWDGLVHGRKMFILLLRAGEAVEAAGKVVGQDGTSAANVSWGDEGDEGVR